MVDRGTRQMEEEAERGEVRVRLWPAWNDPNGIIRVWKEKPVRATVYIDVARAIKFRQFEKERAILDKGKEDWVKLT